jgi:glutathione transport system permease protein
VTLLGTYVARRLLQTTPILFVVSLLIFSYVRLIPGDPARLVAGLDATEEEIRLVRSQLGLDKPWHVQYVRWVNDLLHGHLGRTIRTGRPLSEELLVRFGLTLRLTALSMAVALALGVVAGVAAAVRRNTPVDFLGMTGAVVGISMPSFWLGLLLIALFAVYLRWFPVGGYQGLRSLVLPAITLGTGVAAIVARFTRSSMLEVLEEDFIRTARAKGVAERSVIYRHALRNALIPVVTAVGLEFGGLLGGAVITESVFALPGIGRFLVDSIAFRDYPAVQCLMLVFSLQFILVNLAVDVAYAAVDPRIRYD